jgi:hypothetical protein
MRLASYLLAALGAMSTATLAADANPCGIRLGPAPALIRWDDDSDIDALARVPELMAGGYFTSAAAVVKSAFPERELETFGKSARVDATLRLWAQIIARAADTPAPRSATALRAAPRFGARIARRRTPVVSAQEQTLRLGWAVEVLTMFASETSDPDPTLLSDLATALSQIEGENETARFMLETLSDRDLLTTAEGYAALSHLRGLSGEVEASEQAHARCRVMARYEAACGDRRRLTSAAAASSAARTAPDGAVEPPAT